MDQTLFLRRQKEIGQNCNRSRGVELQRGLIFSFIDLCSRFPASQIVSFLLTFVSSKFIYDAGGPVAGIYLSNCCWRIQVLFLQNASCVNYVVHIKKLKTRSNQSKTETMEYATPELCMFGAERHFKLISSTRWPSNIPLLSVCEEPYTTDDHFDDVIISLPYPS